VSLKELLIQELIRLVLDAEQPTAQAEKQEQKRAGQ